MITQLTSSYFQTLIEQVETLPPDDQLLLMEIINQRLIEHRRNKLLADIAEAREAYQQGDVQRGNVDDLMKTLTA